MIYHTAKLDLIPLGNYNFHFDFLHTSSSGIELIFQRKLSKKKSTLNLKNLLSSIYGSKQKIKMKIEIPQGN